jgi:phosphohistidine phosphatase
MDAVKRRVWLLRHAKSSWDDPGLADEERPLAARGRRAAAAMASHLADAGVRPDLVLCSSGLRARETLAAVLPSLGDELEVRIEPDLYTFDASRVVERLRRVADEVSSVMVVGHNPALQEAALAIASTGKDRARVAEKLPTGALVVVDLSQGSWSSIGDGGGELVMLVAPRDLADDVDG